MSRYAVQQWATTGTSTTIAYGSTTGGYIISNPQPDYRLAPEGPLEWLRRRVTEITDLVAL